MVYHNMMNSDDERVARSMIKEQEKSKYKECWFGNMQEEAEEIGMRVNERVNMRPSESPIFIPLLSSLMRN